MESGFDLHPIKKVGTYYLDEPQKKKEKETQTLRRRGTFNVIFGGNGKI